MLYKKNQTKALDPALFKNPTAEYRGAPFWAWNCVLEEDELLRQIECLKEMGFGGFHMHTRSGMATKYLSAEFMQLVKCCVEKAKREDMLAWLYDEDRWPSGAAGGMVTKNPVFRGRRLILTQKPMVGTLQKEEAVKTGATYFLAAYEVRLNERGELAAYRRMENGDTDGATHYAYVEVEPPRTPGWHNGATYVDTLNPDATRRFIELTHEKYKSAVGDDFGAAVPAIFTDEPQFPVKRTLPYAKSKDDVTLPWTADFDESFRTVYGFDLVERLPELFWELPDGAPSVTRYNYHDYICERFVTAFSDVCGAWCCANGLSLTGHMMDEPTLSSQTAVVGEAMRAYRSFALPGIDMLFDGREYTTAKQAQSAVHQYGREGVLSELYGVTDWDFDFRGHKQQGDWQAALGVTVRVPHLSWVSMKGSAKRDYPASINYQSPWYKEYSYIENHFARLATVLTRGKPCVHVGVIHPVESCWLHWGPSENTYEVRRQLDWNFQKLVSWLLFDTIDFDLISEACLPDLCGEIGETLAVGEMQYSAVVVPGCETLRQTTVDILNRLLDNGGRVIFAGGMPRYVDAVLSDEGKKLYARSIAVPYERLSIVNALEPERRIRIRDGEGRPAEQFIYQLREDGDVYWLFIANPEPPPAKFTAQTNRPTHAVIEIKGEFTPTRMDTLCGEQTAIDFAVEDGFTTVYYDFYEQDSLLVRLAPCTARAACTPQTARRKIAEIDFRDKVGISLEEENVCLLDIAEYTLDGGPVCGEEEILRIDKALRQPFGWPLANGRDVQPWAIEPEKTEHFVTLYFRFDSEIEPENTCLCAEELAGLCVNGEEVALCENGFYVDKAIKKYPLPKLKRGENSIVVRMPFLKRTGLEACYLTGNFGVRVQGCRKTLIAPVKKIAFGSIVSQGLPFYSGNLTYRTKISVPKTCTLCVNIARYAGALTRVLLDGEDRGAVVFSPYELEIRHVPAGEHTVEFELFGNRFNTFGTLHKCVSVLYEKGNQYAWYTEGDAWCYEYDTRPFGILKSPVLRLYEE